MTASTEDKIPWYDEELPLINKAWSDRTLKAKMREAADEVCATMLFMMEMGMLQIPIEERNFISENGFATWAACFFEQMDRANRRKP